MKPQICTIWPFTEKVGWARSRKSTKALTDFQECHLVIYFHSDPGGNRFEIVNWDIKSQKLRSLCLSRRLAYWFNSNSPWPTLTSQSSSLPQQRGDFSDSVSSTADAVNPSVAPTWPRPIPNTINVPMPFYNFIMVRCMGERLPVEIICIYALAGWLSWLEHHPVHQRLQVCTGGN